ncbi:MAG: polysaccharide biosynthesis/export family protein [Ahrensia sp.]
MASHSTSRRARLTAGAALLVLPLAGCASMAKVENREEVSKGLSYQAQYRAIDGNEPQWLMTAKQQNVQRCSSPLGGSDAIASIMSNDVPYLSDGDLLAIDVEGDDTFSGTFEVSQDGKLRLPHLGPVSATGRTIDEVERSVSKALVAGSFYNVAPRVSVRIQDTAPARVFVSGAVFNAGAVSVGGSSGPDADQLRKQAVGGTSDGRRLSRALQSAGGIRPDADLSNVAIIRNGKTLAVDARNAMNGMPYDDMILLDGDHIKVASLTCFQEALVAPSPVTAPGVKVFMSNLTQPASSNASSAIGKEARELRYGTRFLDAVVGMNCMGGTKMVNANRSAVLISRNPISGESIVIERNIEQLLRDADRDDSNPFMMPGDAMACYDSTATNVIEIARGFSTVATVTALLSN